MAIEFGGTSIQQSITEKLQDQLARQVDTKQEAKPEDIEKFKAQMGNNQPDVVKDNPMQENNVSATEANKPSFIESGQSPLMPNHQTLQASPDSSSTEKVGDTFQSPGDQILKTMVETRKTVREVDSITSTETTRNY